MRDRLRRILHTDSGYQGCCPTFCIGDWWGTIAGYSLTSSFYASSFPKIPSHPFHHRSDYNRHLAYGQSSYPSCGEYVLCLPRLREYLSAPTGRYLILRDGTYSPVSIDCSSNARNGTAASSITIRAENERKAWIKSDGSSDTLDIISCSYWRFEGLRMSSQDADAGSAIMWLRNSHQNVFQRNLIHHSNRLQNNHMVLVGYPKPSNNNVFIENEFYYFHRYAIITTSNGSGTVRAGTIATRADMPRWDTARMKAEKGMPAFKTIRHRTDV